MIAGKQTRLAEVCFFKTGKLNSDAAEKEGAFPFFTCAQETYSINTAAFATEAVILGGNNANGIFPLKYYNGEFNAYQRTYIIETRDPEKLHVRFLYFALMPALGQFQKQAIGAATQYLTKPILDNFKIFLPEDIQVQKKISGILSAYDDLIENNRRRIKLLEESARLLYREWFVHRRFPGHENTKVINGLPEGWKKQPLGDCLTLNYGKALKSEVRTDGLFQVYGSSGIIGSHNKALVKGACIIVGRKSNVGSVFWSTADCWPIDTVYFVNKDESNLYLYYALQSMTFISTDVAVPGLNREFAYSREVLIPKDKILSEFIAEASLIRKQIETLEQYNEKLVEARDLLLPRLMSGELEV